MQEKVAEKEGLLSAKDQEMEALREQIKEMEKEKEDVNYIVKWSGYELLVSEMGPIKVVEQAGKLPRRGAEGDSHCGYKQQARVRPSEGI